MDDLADRYSFDPLERRGLLLGLQLPQVAVAAAGVIAAWFTASSLPSPAGPALAMIVALSAAGGTVWSKDAHSAPKWATIALRWSASRIAGAGTSPRPEEGEVVHSEVGATRVRRQHGSRTPLREVAIVDLPDQVGEAPIGVVIDGRSGTLAAVLPVEGGSFLLSDPSDQARRLELWRIVLNVLGRPGTSVRRVQWIQRVSPASNEPLLHKASTVGHFDPRVNLAVDSYRQVAAGAAVDGRVHEAWLIVSVSGLAGLSGLGTIKARDAIRRETRLLAGRLRSAELSTEGAVDASAISEIFEAAHAEDGGSRGVVPVRHWRPMADEDHWSVYRAGGTWHATYWIAEWPRIDVGPEFMSPLLLGGRRRTVSMTMSPIPPDRAAREARSARTSDLADERLRSQAGFLPSARRDRVADGAARREAELADGHVDYRFSGYVTVTSVSRSELDAACAETEQAALSARLEIRRLYGRQREAFTWTLPIGRGLR